MIDDIKPWLFILWGLAMLVPFIVKKPGRMWGYPLTRRDRPYVFWITLVVGVAIFATGARGAWLQLTDV